ncbi:hypothetical protein CTI12_AA361210 [Artemisia annua]|uniref:Uncharacterized protein n=1 Tax=Artemisia annua TaxID=35608 RepID=A0A2U1MNF1_ARTAN|nr:hypothetical protein CTI12_AA361210 [Artemisia annua]
MGSGVYEWGCLDNQYGARISRFLDNGSKPPWVGTSKVMMTRNIFIPEHRIVVHRLLIYGLAAVDNFGEVKREENSQPTLEVQLARHAYRGIFRREK